MNYGISCSYVYTGDEAPWEAFVDRFLKNIAADAEIRNKFHYLVNIGQDGKTRVHIGHWDTPQTVSTLMARPYFRDFADDLHHFGGASLTATFFENYRSSNSWQMNVA